MVAFPPCKINLGLSVLRRRDDGYHDIETCFYPVPRTDILEIVPAAQLSLSVSGHRIAGSDDDNLCLKAYRLLQQDYHVPPVAIHLHKVIPAGAGLGGGSSDGTSMLRLLNEVFQLNITDARLAEYALVLGSDCPFFLHATPMVGTGRGEKLSQAHISLKGKYLIMVRPDVHVSTQSAYQAIVPGAAAASIRSIVEDLPPERWRDTLVNQFEPFVMSTHPVVGQIRKDLYHAGAFYASMSGSGSAVFGLFTREVNLAPAFAGVDYWGGWLEA